MPAVQKRMAAREEEAALTATITEFQQARNGSYTELELQQAIGSTNVAAIEAIIAGGTVSTRQIDDAWRLRALIRELNELATLPVTPRTNPRARSMTRSGRKYAILKDRHTKAFYKEVDAITAAIEAETQSKNSVRGRRKVIKNQRGSGNQRAYKAALRRKR